MKNLAHSASFHSGRDNAPSNPGTKHLAASQKAMLDASNEIARVHGKLLDVGREVGSGMVDDCPPKGALAVSDNPVTLVRAA